ncbi:GTP-binding protein [Nonomuraea sp. NPDC049480]|uniref:GTP-binding protein n=1 Tax=Nonomuraea sp. NPDC049480 TaxID=3364353 RepID=UPI003791EA35
MALCPRELAERVDPATALLPCDAQTGAVTTVVWHRLRPLHPARLFAAAEEPATCSVRGRGRFWPASRHERMPAWDAVAGRSRHATPVPGWRPCPRLGTRPPARCRQAARSVGADGANLNDSATTRLSQAGSSRRSTTAGSPATC